MPASDSSAPQQAADRERSAEDAAAQQRRELREALLQVVSTSNLDYNTRDVLAQAEQKMGFAPGRYSGLWPGDPDWKWVDMTVLGVLYYIREANPGSAPPPSRRTPAEARRREEEEGAALDGVHGPPAAGRRRIDREPQLDEYYEQQLGLVEAPAPAPRAGPRPPPGGAGREVRRDPVPHAAALPGAAQACGVAAVHRAAGTGVQPPGHAAAGAAPGHPGGRGLHRHPGVRAACAPRAGGAALRPSAAGCLSPGAPGRSARRGGGGWSPSSWTASPCAQTPPRSTGTSGTNLEPSHFATYYQPTKVLGEGNFGTVHKCTHMLDQSEYAVKCIATTGSRDTRRKLEEARQLAKCIDIHIVRLLDCWQEGGSLYLKLEYCAHGNLVDVYMRQRPRRQPPPRQRPLPLQRTPRRRRPRGPRTIVSDDVLWTLLEQMGRALAVVHSQGFAHLDVKPPNIFVASLGRKPVYKLGDFGLCRSLLTGGDSQSPGIGSIQEGDGRYMPRDIYNDKSHAQEADIFALGMSAYELAVQEEMRNLHGDQESLRQPGEVARRLDGKCHPRIRSLVSDMVDADPSKRPTAAVLRLKGLMKDSDDPAALPSGSF